MVCLFNPYFLHKIHQVPNVLRVGGHPPDGSRDRLKTLYLCFQKIYGQSADLGQRFITHRAELPLDILHARYLELVDISNKFPGPLAI